VSSPRFFRFKHPASTRRGFGTLAAAGAVAPADDGLLPSLVSGFSCVASSEAGAEALPQQRADQLIDDDPLDGFWRRRQEAATGQRRCRPAA